MQTLYRKLAISIGVLLSLYIGALFAFANPPTSPYVVGSSTLDPSCAPGDINCTVALFSGTSNYIPKFTGANTIGNSLIQDNGTTVNIGYAPGAFSATTDILQVSHDDTWSNPASDPDGYSGIQIRNTDTTANTGAGLKLYSAGMSAEAGVAMYAPSTDNSNLGFYTENNGSRGFRMLIRSDGNVGIGTTNPTIKLQVGAGTALGLGDAGGIFSPQIGSFTTTGVAAIGVGVNDGTNNRRAGLFVDQTNGLWGLSETYGTGSIPFVIHTGNGEVVRILANGNFGIGTTTPSALFSVGTASPFQVDSNGNITKLNNITTSFPGSQGSAGSMLVNDGAGTLSWSSTLGNITQSPTTSTAVSAATVTGAFQSVVAGHIAYVAQAGNGTFAVVDLRNIASPTVLTTVTPPGSGGVYWLKVAGDYLYVVSGTNFTIYDIKAPTSPVQLSTTAGGSFYFSIDVQGKYAYVLDNSTGALKIYDITNPASPTLVGTATVPVNSYQVTVSGRYAYVGANNNGVSIVDISNPASPTVPTTLSGFTARAVTVSGSLLFTTGNNGDRYYDITNPTSPALVENLNNNGYKIAIAGHYAFYGNKMYDISDPTTPVVVNSAVSSGGCSVPTIYGKYVFCPQSNQLQIYSTTGIDTFGITAGNIEAGQANIIHDLDVGGHVFATNGLSTGQAGAYIGGALGVKGDSLFGGKIALGTTTPSYNLDIEQTTTGVVGHFVNSSGYCDVNPTTASLVCSSDIRLKKNITATTNILDKVTLLRAVSYNWNSEADTDPTHPGFIAQEVESIFPEVVSTDAQGYKAIAYSAFTPLLAEAIKELNLKVTNLADLTQPDNSLIGSLRVWLGSATNGITDFFAGRVHTNELCVGDTCLNEAQVKAILQATNTTVTTPPTGVDITPPATPTSSTDTTSTTTDGTTSSGTTDTNTIVSAPPAPPVIPDSTTTPSTAPDTSVTTQ